MKETLFFAILALVTALALSSVAIYFSVAGLVAIFAAAPISIIVLGGILEISKLVSVVWLHKFWKNIGANRKARAVRNYLCFGVIFIMILTSVGIFGFLSKAHTEQTSANIESVAQIEKIESEIARQNAIIARSEEKIKKTETSGTGSDFNIQSQIDREQARIESSFQRIKSVEETIETQLVPLKRELASIDQILTDLQTAINDKNIRKAQSIVGTRPDGQYGPATAEKIESFRIQQKTRRQELLDQLDAVRHAPNPEIQFARNQIKDSNELLNRLRGQLGTGVSEDIDSIIDEQNSRIKNANIVLDNLTEEKYKLQAEGRKLEAEVGPIKFVAEFIYGESDKNLLEKAVRWMIVLIVVVFDPLAVALLVASQFTFQWYKDEKKLEKDEDLIPIAEEPVDKIVVVNEEIDTDVELVEKIAEDLSVLDDPDVQSVLDSRPDLQQELAKYLERKGIVKPQEDISVEKPAVRKGGWLDN